MGWAVFLTQMVMATFVRTENSFITVCTGFGHGVFVTEDGRAFSIGYNQYGQLGIGHKDVMRHRDCAYCTNVSVQIMTGVADCACYQEACILSKDDKTAWAFGSSYQGSLGNGVGEDKAQTLPVQVMSDVASVRKGWLHTAFIKTDGTKWLVGSNGYGQLCQRTEGFDHAMLEPVQLMVTGILDIALGHSYTIILKDDGTVLGCGDSRRGQLCKMTPQEKPGTDTPTSLGLTGVVSLAVRASSSFFLKGDGSVWACGSNYYGGLGVGSTEQSVFSAVYVMNEVSAVFPVGSHNFFLKKDGTLWGTGKNNGGQLGDGSMTNRKVPVQLTNLTDIYFATGDGDWSVFLKKDGQACCGSAWVSGQNRFGQMGMHPNGGPFLMEVITTTTTTTKSTTTKEATTTAAAMQSVTDDTPETDSGLGVGPIVGIALGSVMLLMLALGGWHRYQTMRRALEVKKTAEYATPPSGGDSSSPGEAPRNSTESNPRLQESIEVNPNVVGAVNESSGSQSGPSQKACEGCCPGGRFESKTFCPICGRRREITESE